MVRTLDLTVNGREIRTFIADLKRQEFEVQMYLTETEQAARDGVEAAAEVQRKIDALPKSAEAFRKRIVEDIAHFTGVVIDSASTSSFDGYRLHPETIAELQRLTGHMENAIEIGEVVFDRKARTAAEAKIVGEATKAAPENDMKYLRFKHSLTPRLGWTGNKKLRAEANALYEPEDRSAG
jgi:uncharacterized Zn finger protein